MRRTFSTLSFESGYLSGGGGGPGSDTELGSATSVATSTRALLNEIFPPHIVEALRRHDTIEPELFPHVYVLFADVVGYTTMCKESKPLDCHRMLNNLYTTADYCLSFFPRLYKVETIGDCLVVLGGAPIHTEDCLDDMLRFAMLLSNVIPRTVVSPANGQLISIRIGLHCGEIVGGVVGKTMPRYTFSGDAINVTARLQALSRPNGVLISNTITQLILRKTASKATVADWGDGHDLGVTFQLPALTFLSAGLLELKGWGLLAACHLECRFRDEADGTRKLKSVKSEYAFSSLIGINNKSSPSGSRDDGYVGQQSPVSFFLSQQSQLYHDDQNSSAAKAKEFMNRVDVKAFFLDDSCLPPAPDSGSYDGSESDTEDVDAEATAEEEAAAAAMSALSVSAVGPAVLLNEFGLPPPPPASTSPGGIDDDALSSNSSTSSIITTAASTLSSFKIEPAAPTTDLSILVIEDSVTQRKIIFQQLRSADPTWVVRSAATPAEVMDIMKSRAFQFDLILCDMNLGEGPEQGVTLMNKLNSRYPSAMRRAACVFMSRDSSDREMLAISTFKRVDAFWAKPLPRGDVLIWYVRNVVAARVNEIKVAKISALSSLHGDIPSRNFADMDSPRGSRMPKEAEPIWLQDVSNRLVYLQGYQTESSVAVMKQELDLPDNLRVLVLEDSDIQRKMLVKLLRKCNETMNIVSLPDCTSCIKYLRANDSKDAQLDVAFIDMNLGDEDGMEGTDIVRLMRTTLELDKCLIVGVTAAARRVENSFMDAGADAVWGKPLPPPIVAQHRLNKLLQARVQLTRRHLDLDAPRSPLASAFPFRRAVSVNDVIKLT